MAKPSRPKRAGRLYCQPAAARSSGQAVRSYFVWDIYRLRYRFARFLKNHPAKPASLACTEADYLLVRGLAIVLLRLEIARGLLIVLLVAAHHWLR